MIYEAQAASGSASLADYYLQNGKGTHAYRYFGVHRLLDKPEWSYVFRVAAPGADLVSLVGEWDGWEPAPMHRLEDSGTWELCVRAEICPEGLRYKYLVQTGEQSHYKADPYARASESGGEGASVICTEGHYVWHDRAYLEARALQGEHERHAYPMNLYEAELSGWFDRDAVGTVANFRVIADLLSQYAADMGYTHVLIHSVCCQRAGREGIVSYFAPDGSLGTPDDFAYFVDRMHKEGVGVLMELECRTPGAHVGGLINFDGAGAYTTEQDGRVCFDYADPYATTLLYSSAMFWLREFHLDGLSLCAQGMAADRHTGEFLRTMAQNVRRGAADALLILRASGYRGLSTDASYGGLGYDLVINSRTEDALVDSLATSLELRLGRQAWRQPLQDLYAEAQILALSGNLIRQRAGSVFGMLQGTYEQKFAAMRLLYLFMTCLPGKKLSFMGNEIGQTTEWRLHDGVEWFVRELDMHRQFSEYVRSLNRWYLQTPALFECDRTKEGMTLVRTNLDSEGVLSFKRFDRAGNELCIVLNFSDRSACDLRVEVGGRYPYYEQVFCSQDSVMPVCLQIDADGMLTTDLPGLSGLVLAPKTPARGFWLENV